MFRCNQGPLPSDHPRVLPAAANRPSGSVGTGGQLERLISNGADPDASDYDMRTAMHLAAASGAQKSMEYLLKNGASPNATDRWGAVPLLDAVKGGHRTETLYIKRHGGQLSDDLSGAAGAALLREAALTDNVSMLQLLKDAGVDLDHEDYDLRFPLHLAAHKGRLLTVSYLISMCSNPNMKDRWGRTPVEDARGTVTCTVPSSLRQMGGGWETTPPLRCKSLFPAWSLWTWTTAERPCRPQGRSCDGEPDDPKLRSVLSPVHSSWI